MLVCATETIAVVDALNIVFGVVGIIALIYSVALDSRYVRIEGLKATQQMRSRFTRLLQLFERWVQDGDFSKRFPFSQTVSWDHEWHAFFGQFSWLFRKNDQQFIYRLRERIFEIADHLYQNNGRISPDERDRIREEIGGLLFQYGGIRRKEHWIMRVYLRAKKIVESDIGGPDIGF